MNLQKLVAKQQTSRPERIPYIKAATISVTNDTQDEVVTKRHSNMFAPKLHVTKTCKSKNGEWGRGEGGGGGTFQVEVKIHRTY